jgi:VanZ family protein
MAVIFAVSAQSNIPEPPGGVTDKHEHFVAYAGLSALACRAASGTIASVSPGGALAGWAIASVYGLSDEYHQSFVPGRSPDLMDALADTAGAASAATALWAWGIIARSRRERRSVAPPA